MTPQNIERYRVSRHDDVDFIRRAIRSCGARIVEEADPCLAPFTFRILTPRGEFLNLICYAFHANRYAQLGRPNDEHRFQIKYGSDFDRYHDIYIATDPGTITLMFGVHLEEGVFVAVDPTMHNPTWFSRSVEFKDHNIEEAKRGWAGWERDRKTGRRKIAPPRSEEECWRTEVLLGFTPENFLRYVQFERIATGMDAGERLLTIDRLGRAPGRHVPHPLELELGMTAEQILDMIGDAFRLKVAIRGGTAEHHLQRHLSEIRGMTEVQPLDQDGMPDFRIVFRSGPPCLIECKNVLRRSRQGVARIDFQRTRASKADPCSRYYKASEFHILAACMHPVSETWEFLFARTETLPPHPRCDGRLAQNVIVDGPAWTSDVTDLLA